MKQIYKNPTLYYILVPAVLGLWPLLVWGVYLSESERSLNEDINQYEEARKTAEMILTRDRDRLVLTDANSAAAEFNYATAVDRIARSCGIQPTNYKLSSGMVIKSGGKKSRSAKVILEDVDMARFAEFLSKIQLRWANLQCTKIKLTAKKGLRDTWVADIDFKYYY